MSAHTIDIPTEDLLQELLRRNALKACSATFTIDGRAARQVRRTIDATAENEEMTLDEIEQRFLLFLELKALEVMAAGLATASAENRVHVVSVTAAENSLPPGSLRVEVQMLAVAVNLPKSPTDFSEDAPRVTLDG